MTESLRTYDQLRRLRRGAGVVLALGVAALLVIPGLGLILALLGLVVLLAISLAKGERKEPPR